MALLDYLFPPQQNPMMGLLGADEEKLRQQAQQAGLLNAGLGIIAASGPSRQPQGLLQPIATGLMAGQQAYQGALDQQVQNQLNTAKFAEMKRKMDIQKLLPSLYTETTDAQGNVTRQINKDIFQQIAMQDPALGMSIADTQIKARKAGLTRETEADVPSPFAPYLQAQNPQVRTLAEQLTRGFKSGVIDEETAFKRIDALARMEGDYVRDLRDEKNRAADKEIARLERESKKGDLTTEQQKQVTGAQNTINAIQEFKNELDKFDPRSMANLSPRARANIQTKYRNMQLQAKEAYNLGVLNGPDLTIIEQLVADPTSYSGVMVGKQGIQDQASELSRIIKDIGTVASQKPKTTSEAATTQPTQTNTQQATQQMTGLPPGVIVRKKGQ